MHISEGSLGVKLPAHEQMKSRAESQKGKSEKREGQRRASQRKSEERRCRCTKKVGKPRDIVFSNTLRPQGVEK